jgi:hypothetical protein
MAAIDLTANNVGEWFTKNGTTGTTNKARQVIVPEWCEVIRVHSIGVAAVALKVSHTGTDDDAQGSDFVEVPANNCLPIIRGAIGRGSWSVFISDRSEAGSAAFAVDPIHKSS